MDEIKIDIIGDIFNPMSYVMKKKLDRALKLLKN
jgi:hypothetical protein